MLSHKKIIIKQPEIGKFIQEIRLLMGLTQEEFAVILGVSFPTVNRWENGHTQPSKLAIQQIQGLVDKLGENGQILLKKYKLITH